MSKDAHPCAVLRGHQGDVQALTFDHSETHLISGDAHGEVRVWALEDLRPRSIRRLHPASAGIINLKLWRTSVPATATAAKVNYHDTAASKQACCSVLVSQGRDGTTHLWELDNEMNIVEAPPIRSFVREAFSFCRFSLLAPDLDTENTVHLQFHRLSGQTPAAAGAASASLHSKQNAEAFVKAVLGGDNDADNISPSNNRKDIEMEETESLGKLSSSDLVQSAIAAIHTCSSPSPAAALIAIPSHSEKVVEVCCAACGTPLAMFLQKESEAATLPEQDKWGMCMATKLFLGPKEVDNDILLAVGYESGHVVLWSVTAAVKAYTTATAAVAAASVSPSSSSSSSSSRVPYTPPKPLAYAKLHSEPIMALDIDNNGSSGISGSAEDALIAFAIEYTSDDNGAIRTAAAAMVARILPTATINLKKQGVADVAVRSDGKLIASAGWDGKIRLYKKSNGKALAVFKYHSAAASAVVFSPKTFLIASGARDGTVALWDVYSKQKN